MRNRTYGGVRGRKTKVGRKLLRFPPTRLETEEEPEEILENFEGYSYLLNGLDYCLLLFFIAIIKE